LRGAVGDKTFLVSGHIHIALDLAVSISARGADAATSRPRKQVVRGRGPERRIRATTRLGV